MDDETSSITDSGIDTDYTSEFESVTSRNYQFRTRHHRKYHGMENNKYHFPCDEEELHRLDSLQFAMRTYLGGKNILVPFDRKPTNILDVGTGSGAWCIEVSDEYPETNVRGIDLSPVQPVFIPRNCEFITMDLTEGLGFDDASQDLVHSRIVKAGLTKQQWPGYIKDIYRILKPGNGWIQIGEFDPRLRCDDHSVPSDAPYYKFMALLLPKLTDLYLNGEHLEPLVRETGFQDIEVKVIKMHNGPWANPKYHDGGRAVTRCWVGAMRVLVEYYLRGEFNSEEEMKEFMDNVQSDYENPNYHLYSIIHFVTGRKPAE